MKIRTLTLFLCLLAVIFFVSSCSSGASSTTPSTTVTLDGATLVQERCTRCHTPARIERARHTSAEWENIVSAMIIRGAKLTAEEKVVVVDYLTVTYGE